MLSLEADFWFDVGNLLSLDSNNSEHTSPAQVVLSLEPDCSCVGGTLLIDIDSSCLTIPSSSFVFFVPKDPEFFICLKL